MGKHRKPQDAAQAEAQAKAAQFDQRLGESVVRAADARLAGHAPYEGDAKLADMKTGRDQK